MDEIKLFERLKKGDEKAREEIFKNNQALVAKIAWSYSRKSILSVEEMIAEGYIGLLHAIDKFNLKKAKTKKIKFSSYAFWWIRRYIIRTLVKKQSILSVPENVSELAHRYNHFAGILSQDLGREPTKTEVRKLMLLSDRQMKNISQRRALKEISLDEHLFAEDEIRTLADVIPAESKEDIEKTLEQDVLIEKYFSVLNPTEKAVIDFRFGLHGCPQLTYREISNVLEKKFKKRLSHQRIHQIFRAALKKIITLRKKEMTNGKMEKVN